MKGRISMSGDDQEGRRMVQISFHQLDDLKTKLINAIQVQLTMIIENADH